MKVFEAAECRRAFTLIELLVVIAVIGVLAALLLPVLSRAKARAKQTTCLDNVRQIAIAIHLYAADNGDTLPAGPDAGGGVVTSNHWAIVFKRLVRSYVGLSGASSQDDRVFACPADTFYYDFPSLAYESQGLHEQAASDYSSYGFNGANGNTNNPAICGIAGWKQGSIRDPVKTVLIMESSGFFPWSWHQPQRLPVGRYGIIDAKNMTAFVDGHVAYTKIYWNSNFDETTCNYNPPPGYDYKWSGD